MIVIDNGSEYCKIESQKVGKKEDFPIELGKRRQELYRKKVVRPKGIEKVIVVDDSFGYCETEGKKMENKDQGGITEMIAVENDPAVSEKRWKETAMRDPDNTRQISSGSPPRRIKESICITDPEHLLKKNVGERDSYKQRKENQSRKQYSLRSKAKEQKEESYIGSSATLSLSSRKSASAMEPNKIFVCTKPVSPDMKTPTEQAGNQYGDQAVSNYMSCW